MGERDVSIKRAKELCVASAIGRRISASRCGCSCSSSGEENPRSAEPGKVVKILGQDLYHLSEVHVILVSCANCCLFGCGEHGLGAGVGHRCVSPYGRDRWNGFSVHEGR